ncbi:MAG: aminoglycoside phosphotransferase family protein [Planctomycetales bacterium]|nr:aminoglycoside phosphotransferase family protein [Planctomycetales bacterium]
MPADPIPSSVRQNLLVENQAEVGDRAVGGLSQASVWKCQSPSGPLCLRVWPSHVTETQLTIIHRAMQLAAAAGLSFVPRLFHCRKNYGIQLSTAVHDGRQFWELSEWLPGKADYLQLPGWIRLKSAIGSLADAHRIWSQESVDGPSPTVAGRILRLQQWLGPWGSDVIQLLNPTEQLEATLVAETAHYLKRFGPTLVSRLKELSQEHVRQHFVLRDPWSDHILFEGDRVTGLIDYGAGRIDDPAADVARMLGSLEPTNKQLRDQAVRVYNELTYPINVARVELFVESTNLLSALQWLQWLVIEKREFSVRRQALLYRWAKFLEIMKLQEMSQNAQ